MGVLGQGGQHVWLCVTLRDGLTLDVEDVEDVEHIEGASVQTSGAVSSYREVSVTEPCSQDRRAKLLGGDGMSRVDRSRTRTGLPPSDNRVGVLGRSTG